MSLPTPEGTCGGRTDESGSTWRCSGAPSRLLHPRSHHAAWRHAGLRGRNDVERGHGGCRTEKLPGHEGLVPPGATLVGPAPSTTALPLTLTLKPRDPSTLATEAQQLSDPEVAGVPPLPDTHAVRTGVRTDAGHYCAGHVQPPQEGLTVGTPSATRLSLPVSGSVAQVQSAFSTRSRSTGCLPERRDTTMRQLQRCPLL